MADVQYYLHKILFFALVVRVVTSLPTDDFDYLNELENPCFGRKDGFVRDLSSCQNYFQCDNGQPVPGACDSNFVFDAESEQCVGEENTERVCFRCPDNTFYELVSVPNICIQYIRCFNGIPSLRVCPSGLAFDGRAGIHQCNVPPSTEECFREDLGDVEHQTCPPVYDEPIYYVEQNNPSVYGSNGTFY